MSDLKKAAEILRKAAESLENDIPVPVTSTITHPTSINRPTSSSARPETAVMTPVAEVRRLFSPYNRPNSNSSKNTKIRTGTRPNFKPNWSHRFFCLASTDQNTKPDSCLKRELQEAGLGEKKIFLHKNDDSIYFKQEILLNFPKLADGGGFDLSRISNRTNLEVIIPPSQGYTTNFLLQSYIGPAIIYVRPLQKDLSTQKSEIEECDLQPTEACMECDEQIAIINMRNHIQEVHEDVKIIPSARVKRKSLIQTAVCQLKCNTAILQTEAPCTENKCEVQCPICKAYFASDIIEVHSASCGEKADKDVSCIILSTLKEELLKIVDRRQDDKSDNILKFDVVRSKFIETAMDQLQESDVKDFERPKFSVEFIGEEGVDESGLTREFFSLLFQTTPLFGNGLLNYDTQALENGHYKLMGRAIAMAIILGHPGPRCFSDIIVSYITRGIIPNFKDMSNTEVTRQDALAAIKDIDNATVENIDDVFESYADILNISNFQKKLSIINRDQATTAIKAHFLFYGIMGPILQLMEGLKLYNILHLLQSYPEESQLYLVKDAFPAPTAIIEFFKVSFTTDDDGKLEKEKTIIYNLKKLLNRVEKKKVSTTWINPDNGFEELDVQINTGHILQALVGCPQLPSNISQGLIIFDHLSNRLSHVNTCAPSLTFSNIENILDFEKFEESFLCIVVGSYGFGMQ